MAAAPVVADDPIRPVVVSAEHVVQGRQVSLLAAGLCCAIAFALRSSGLGIQSLWLDEGATFFFGSLPVGALLQATFHREPNPPLYYLLLHAWLAPAGSSEVALRFPSVLAGVLTVALIYRLGRDLVGPLAATGAAALTASSAYLIWYSQEARSFSLLACLGTATLLLFVRAYRRPAWPRLIGFSLFLTLTLYTHFFGAFVLLVLVAALILQAGRASRRRAWVRWLVAVGGAVALYIPWLGAMLRAGAAAVNWRAPASLAAIGWQSAVAFADDGVLPEIAGRWLAIVEIVLVGLCILALASDLLPPRLRAGKGAPAAPRLALLLPVGVVLPMLAIAVLSRLSAIFAVSYVVAQAPLVYLASSVGLSRTFRRVPWLAGVGCAILVGVGLLSTATLRHDPRFRKEDFRGAAQYLTAHTRPGDIVILQAEYARLPFDYYYHGPGLVVPYAASPNQGDQALPALTSGHDVAWLLLSHADQVDPQGKVHAWLDAHYPLISQAFPTGIQLFGYRLGYVRLDVPPAVTRLALRYGSDLALLGYQATDGIPARDIVLHPPSNWLHVVLYWQALAPISTPYRVSVQMVDGRGVWGAELNRPRDALAFAAARPWQPGEVVVEDVDINLNPVTPAGTYQLLVRLLAPSGQPLAIAGGAPTVGTVRITAP